MVSCFLALGSNLGDRENHFRAALSELAQRGAHVVQCASLYFTEPKGMRLQPWFLNTTIQVMTDATPEALLTQCLEIEAGRGRQRTQIDGPRTLDIDIIFFGQRIVQEKRLTIPHPRYEQRRFVLEPLAEIAAAAVDPVSGLSVQELLDRNQDQAAVRWYAPPLI